MHVHGQIPVGHSIDFLGIDNSAFLPQDPHGTYSPINPQGLNMSGRKTHSCKVRCMSG